LADLGQAGEAVHLRHAQVEQNELGLQPSDQRQHLDAVDGLADDLEAAGLLEGLFCAFDHQAMVICNQYSQLDLLPNYKVTVSSARNPSPKRVMNERKFQSRMRSPLMRQPSCQPVPGLFKTCGTCDPQKVRNCGRGCK